MTKKKLLLLGIGLVILVTGGLFFYRSSGSTDRKYVLQEHPLILLPLTGPAAARDAEISGLAWYGDDLILLPQYPNFSDESGDGFLYALPRAEIRDYVDGASGGELEPKPIKLIAPGLADKIPNFQGFESIGFSGERIFFTIEAGEGEDMMGYLASGTITPDLSALTVDTSNLVSLPPQAVSENHADESLLVLEDRVITFYEVNGEAIVTNPVAHVFNFDLKPLGTIPMTNLEYRLTDTALANGNEFWGINYFFPGDSALAPLTDPIAERYGKSSSQADFEQVERLVKFQYSDAGITLADAAPVSLALVQDARNWEGLVLLDERGFLLATDKFPSTLLVFVSMP